jgi:hypothetical protein
MLIPSRKPVQGRTGCANEVWVGSLVPEVLAARVASLATMWRNRDDRALRLDRLLAGSSLHLFRYPR